MFVISFIGALLAGTLAISTEEKPSGSGLGVVPDPEKVKPEPPIKKRKRGKKK